MLAYAWDGLPLTPEHGFPRRIYLPGRYEMKQPSGASGIQRVRTRRVASSVIDTAFMIGILHAHSGLRYLVLLMALVVATYCLFGLATKRPYDRGLRILGAIYVAVLDTQILLGGALIATGLWYPQLAGHLAMMLLAAGASHATLAINRRRPQPGYALPLIGVLLSLVLIAGGILAIGRGVFAMTVAGTA